IDQTTNKVDNKTFELQYVRRWNWINTVIGVGYTGQERTKATLTGVNLTSPLSSNLQQELEDVGLPLETAGGLITFVNDLQNLNLDRENSEESFLNGYFYSTIKPVGNLNLSIGAGVHSLHRNSDQSDRLDVTSVYVSPKIGAMWEPFPSTRIRAAWFQEVRRPFPSDQTIEPTQVAGFNQLFDDGDGTRFQRYGVGVDQKLPLNLLSGFEFTWRDLKIPRFVTSSSEGDRETKRIVQEETAHRAYLQWTPTEQTTLSAEYFYEQFDREFETDLPSDRFLSFSVGTPLDMELHRVPFSLNYYHPNGFFAGITATYVVQDVTLRGETIETIEQGEIRGQVLADDASDRFWQTDISIGYRLPKRYGILRFGVLNLFSEDIRFQEA
ncbi:MAG: TonB-dependent receptor, partial [Nitrososphaera sp.]|nr:TonB-dependent receptor [Nitrososphaera sp.]